MAIRTRGGARCTAAEKVPLGGHERPLTAADPGCTFVALAEPVLGPAAAREAWRAGQALPSVGDVRAWTAWLVPGQGRGEKRPATGRP